MSSNAGTGGSFTFTGGTGGSSFTSGTSGTGGALNLTAGAGGAGFTGALSGNGGNVVINGGAAGGSGAVAGNVLLASSVGSVGVSTTTPYYNLTVASTTGAQLSLSAGAGIAQWVQRNAGGNFYLSTTTVDGTATTSISALEIAGDGFGTTTVRGLNISGQATSTSNVGINLSGGCFAVNGSCISGGSGISSLIGNPLTKGYFLVGDDAGLSQATSSIFVTSTGNVGVGYTSVGTKFAVNGNVTIGDSETYNGKLSVLQDSPVSTALTNTAGINLLSGAGSVINLKIGADQDNALAYLQTVVADEAGSVQKLLLQPHGGLVGIGTTTPVLNGLTVASSTILTDGAGIAQWVQRNAGGNLYFATTTVEGTSTTTTSALTILGSSGYVGIGTNNPSAPLEISRSGVGQYAGSFIKLTDPSTTNTWSFQMRGDQDVYNQALLISAPGGYETIRVTSGTASNIIHVNGSTANIGFSTTTPGYVLTPFSSTAPQLSLSAGAGFAQTVFRNDGTNLYISTTTVAGTATTSISALEIALGGFGTTTVRGLNISGQATSTSNVGINLSGGCFAVNGSCISGGVGSNSSSTLLADSNTFSGTNNFTQKLGLATTSPFARLSVESQAGEAAFVVGSSTATSLIVDRLGNVGIGTASPSADLHVFTTEGSYDGTVFIENTGVNPVPRLKLKAGSTIWDNRVIGNGAGQYGVVYNEASTYLNINTAGRMSVGGSVSDSLSGLGVVSNLAVGADYYSTVAAPTNGAIIQGASGFGTTTPTYTHQLTISSSTAPQLALSDGTAGIAQWVQRNAGGNLYFATTTVAGTSTTTTSALAIIGSTGQVQVGPNGGSLVVGGTAAGETGSIAVRGNQGTGSSVGISVTNSNTGNLSAGAARFNLVESTAGSNMYMGLGYYNGGDGAAVRFNIGNTNVGSYFVINTNNSGTGIGQQNDAPFGTLLVKNGGASAATSMYIQAGSSQGTTNLLSLQSNATAGSVGNTLSFFNAYGNAGIGTSTIASNITLTVSSSTAPQLALSAGTAGIAQWVQRNAGGNLYFATTTVEGTSTTTTSALSILGTNGFIGVGTTSPWGKLSVSTIGLNGSPAFVIGSSTKTLFSVDNGGITSVGDSSGTGDAVFQIAGDTNAWSMGYYSTDKSFRIASSTNLTSNVYLTINKTGTIFTSSGIGSESGSDNALCIDPTTFEITNGGASCAASSERFKRDIQSLDYGLDEVMALRPVSFKWKEEERPGDDNRYIGFIAEEMLGVIPEVVEFDAEGLVGGIDYAKLTAVNTKALQELNLNLETIASTTASTTPKSDLFAAKFFDNIFAKVRTWLASATNGVGDLFANRLKTKELCVSDGSGSETCITKSQLDSLLAGAVTAQSGQGGGSSGGYATSLPSTTDTGTASTTATTTPADTGNTDSASSTTPVVENPSPNTTPTETANTQPEPTDPANVTENPAEAGPAPSEPAPVVETPAPEPAPAPETSAPVSESQPQ